MSSRVISAKKLSHSQKVINALTTPNLQVSLCSLLLALSPHYPIRENPFRMIAFSSLMFSV
jgi:hypothetical protein